MIPYFLLQVYARNKDNTLTPLSFHNIKIISWKKVEVSIPSGEIQVKCSCLNSNINIPTLLLSDNF